MNTAQDDGRPEDRKQQPPASMFGLVKRAATAAAKPAAARPAPGAMQTRLMSGGHGHGGPPPTGLEAKVRAYLPKDYQIVLATLGFYTSIVLLFKLKPSKKAVEAAPIAAGSSSQADEIPSILSDEFEAWSKIAGNFERWEKSLETMGN